jgi:ankyrin repeat protein
VDVLELLHERVGQCCSSARQLCTFESNYQGGNLNAKDKQNMSPLHRAAWKGQTESIEYLLKHGAHMAHVDSSLKTALHWVVQYGHFSALLALLKVGQMSFCLLAQLVLTVFVVAWRQRVLEVHR